MLYIDREPYENIRLCQLVRMWPTIEVKSLVVDKTKLKVAAVDTYKLHTERHSWDQSKNVIPFVEPKSKFVDVRQVILTHLKQWNTHHFRSTMIDFTSSLLRVLFLLISFGMYEDGEDVLELLHDGTIGLCDELVEIVEQLVPLLAMKDGGEQFELTEFVSMKAKALDVIDSVVSLRMSRRIDTAMSLLQTANHDHQSQISSKNSDILEFSNPLGVEVLGQPASEKIEPLSQAEVKHIAKKLLADDFDKHNEELTRIFVHNLQYTASATAVFNTVQSLIILKLSKLKLINTLEKVVLIENESQACSFFVIKRAVGEFIRLSKRLQEESACVECVRAIDKLRELCVTFENRMMMAQLDCASTISAVFCLDLPTSSFVQLKHHLFGLVSQFVDDCRPNQEALASAVRTVFVPMLHNDEYIEAVSICIGEVMDGNVKLSKEYANALVQVVVALYSSKTFQRRACLLRMLQQLLVSQGSPILDCQLAVCKGVTMAGLPIVDISLSEVDPAAAKTAESQEQRQQNLLTRAYAKRDHSAVEAIDYYMASLELLQTCVQVYTRVYVQWPRPAMSRRHHRCCCYCCCNVNANAAANLAPTSPTYKPAHIM